jgi:hypothetical protein
MMVSVAGVLPEKHSGWLEDQALHPPSLFGGYRMLAALVVVLWIAAFFVIARMDRKRAEISANVPATRAPTFAERLRPLVERAAAGTISPDEKAALERMLIAHWRRRLDLREMDGAELIARLREHPEAGRLLQALEDWLHRPPGGVRVAVDAVLAPYRDLPAEEPVELSGVQPSRSL